MFQFSNGSWSALDGNDDRPPRASRQTRDGLTRTETIRAEYRRKMGSDRRSQRCCPTICQRFSYACAIFLAWSAAVYLQEEKHKHIEDIPTTTDQVVHPQPLAASSAYAQTLDEGVIIPFEQYSMFLGQLYENTSKASAQPSYRNYRRKLGFLRLSRHTLNRTVKASAQ